MRRAVVAAFLVSTLVPIPAQAASRGVVTGHVENAVTHKPQGGVDIALSGVAKDGDEIHRRVRTGSDGSYRFGGLPTGDWIYAIDGTFDGGLFPGRPFTIPSDTTRPPVIDTTLRVWPTTTEPDAILVTRDDLFVVSTEKGIGVIESLTILNHSAKAYIGRGATDSSTAPTFGIAIPPSATGVRVENASIDIPRLVRTDFGVGLTVAIPPDPDGTSITFSYALEGTAGRYTMSRTALYPTAEMSLFAERGLDVESNRLTRDGSLELKGKDYAKYSVADGADAGDEVQIVVTARGAPPWWSFALAAAGVLLLVALIALAMRWRGRRNKDAVPGDDEPQPDRREPLIAAIARLDLEHDQGLVDEAEWTQRRAALKTQLERAGR
ncbi:MAG TPA: hypothetical protein VFK89_01105 [Actinomycetota bacterium]|nr:hypothetical protein [Actinomycetota bacterium]